MFLQPTISGREPIQFGRARLRIVRAGGNTEERVMTLKEKLGRVDGFDQDERARKRDEGSEVLRGLLAA